MYNDNYRKRFTSVAAATYSKNINSSEDGENIIFTPIHDHKDFEILVIKSGKAYFNIDESEFSASAGDVILVNPYEMHSAFALAEFMPFSYYCITFDLSMLLASPIHPATEMCKKLTNGYMKFDHLIKDDKISKVILETEQIFTQKNEGWEFFISSAIFEVFGQLYKNHSYTIMSAPTKSHIFTKEIISFIENNFTENITSAHAAQKLGYDTSYFCRLFKKNFGQSFGEYLNFYRINFANELLKGGSSVSEAALLSGFNNLSYFTKVFKKYNNVPPSKVQKF